MKSVLVIDPDCTLRSQIQARLERHGFVVDHAACYDDALEVLSFSPVDLVVYGRNIPGDEKALMAHKMGGDGISAPIISLHMSGGAERLNPATSTAMPDVSGRRDMGVRIASRLDVRRVA